MSANKPSYFSKGERFIKPQFFPPLVSTSTRFISYFYHSQFSYNSHPPGICKQNLNAAQFYKPRATSQQISISFSLSLSPSLFLSFLKQLNAKLRKFQTLVIALRIVLRFYHGAWQIVWNLHRRNDVFPFSPRLIKERNDISSRYYSRRKYTEGKIFHFIFIYLATNDTHPFLSLNSLT